MARSQLFAILKPHFSVVEHFFNEVRPQIFAACCNASNALQSLAVAGIIPGFVFDQELDLLAQFGGGECELVERFCRPTKLEASSVADLIEEVTPVREQTGGLSNLKKNLRKEAVGKLTLQSSVSHDRTLRSH